MHCESELRLAESTGGAFSPSAAVVGVALCFVVVLAVFWPTTWSMIEMWRRLDTYQHCFLVIPIALWLVWSERARLAATPPAPYRAGLLLMAILGAIWLLGVLAAAQVISQFAIVGLMGAAVLTVFGLRWARILWFPLLFLFFAVPFGEALVPKLMDWTADVTVAALRLTRVPVYREGIHFVIPTGQWSVVEACSGIKYLIASMMAGTLYAWLMYRSPARRLAFVVASFVVPLIANWLRAYLIVLVAHLTGNRLMTGAEHEIFGWILFGVVMFLLYWAGARWREDSGSPASDSLASGVQPHPRPTGLTALAALFVLGAWPPLSHALLLPVGDSGPARIVAPVATAGWELVSKSIADWVPELAGSFTAGTFTFQQGPRQVSVYVAAFRHQNQASQLASTANRLVVSTNERWKETSRGVADVPVDAFATPAQVRTATLRGPRPSDRLAAWQWYWIGETATTSDLRGKLELARARLLRRPDTGLWVAIYTLQDEDGTAAEQALQCFIREMGPSLRAAFSETSAR